jgi:major type 1 subunit fimbrin (pilin)
MKNTKLASALAIAMGLAAVGTASAQSVGNGGTIFFHGTVTDTTCTVKGGAGTGGESADKISVTLPDIPASDLTAANATGGPQQFQILVGEPGEATCGATTSGGSVVATMSFGFGPLVNANGNLDNSLTSANGGATNTQIQLLNNDGSVIDLSKANAGAQNQTIVNNQATMNYTAQYISVPGGATPGKVESNNIFFIAYN